MRTLNRITKIIKSNVSDFLDSVEDPEKMIKQLLMETKEGLKEAEAETMIAKKEQTRLLNRIKECENLVREWDEKVVLALKSKNDALAKEALKKKKEYQAQADDLKENTEKHKERVKNLEEGLEALKAKIREIENNKTILLARKKQADLKKLVHENFQDIEEKLESDVLVAEAGATLASRDIEKKFKALYTEDDLDKELQAIKEKI